MDDPFAGFEASPAATPPPVRVRAPRDCGKRGSGGGKAAAAPPTAADKPLDFLRRNLALLGFSTGSTSLFQTVKELVENSLDSGGREVTVALSPLTRWRAGKAGAFEELWRVAVTDNGCGMAKDKVQGLLGGVFSSSKIAGSGALPSSRDSVAAGCFGVGLKAVLAASAKGLEAARQAGALTDEKVEAAAGLGVLTAAREDGIAHGGTYLLACNAAAGATTEGAAEVASTIEVRDPLEVPKDEVGLSSDGSMTSMQVVVSGRLAEAGPLLAAYLNRLAAALPSHVSLALEVQQPVWDDNAAINSAGNDGTTAGGDSTASLVVKQVPPLLAPSAAAAPFPRLLASQLAGGTDATAPIGASWAVTLGSATVNVACLLHRLPPGGAAPARAPAASAAGGVPLFLLRYANGAPIMKGNTGCALRAALTDGGTFPWHAFGLSDPVPAAGSGGARGVTAAARALAAHKSASGGALGPFPAGATNEASDAATDINEAAVLGIFGAAAGKGRASSSLPSLATSPRAALSLPLPCAITPPDLLDMFWLKSAVQERPCLPFAALTVCINVVVGGSTTTTGSGGTAAATGDSGTGPWGHHLPWADLSKTALAALTPPQTAHVCEALDGALQSLRGAAAAAGLPGALSSSHAVSLQVLRGELIPQLARELQYFVDAVPASSVGSSAINSITAAVEGLVGGAGNEAEGAGGEGVVAAAAAARLQAYSNNMEELIKSLAAVALSDGQALGYDTNGGYGEVDGGWLIGVDDAGGLLLEEGDDSSAPADPEQALAAAAEADFQETATAAHLAWARWQRGGRGGAEAAPATSAASDDDGPTLEELLLEEEEAAIVAPPSKRPRYEEDEEEEPSFLWPAPGWVVAQWGSGSEGDWEAAGEEAPHSYGSAGSYSATSEAPDVFGAFFGGR